MTTADIARFGPAFGALGAMDHDALLLDSAQCSIEPGLKPRAGLVAAVEVNTDPLVPFTAVADISPQVIRWAPPAPS